MAVMKTGLWGHSLPSLRFLVTISRTRAGRHVGEASGEGPLTVSLFSSDNTLSSSVCVRNTRTFSLWLFRRYHRRQDSKIDGTGNATVFNATTWILLCIMKSVIVIFYCGDLKNTHYHSYRAGMSMETPHGFFCAKDFSHLANFTCSKKKHVCPTLHT